LPALIGRDECLHSSLSRSSRAKSGFDRTKLSFVFFNLPAIVVAKISTRLS
jgi:hypothetical protein